MTQHFEPSQVDPPHYYTMHINKVALSIHMDQSLLHLCRVFFFLLLLHLRRLFSSAIFHGSLWKHSLLFTLFRALSQVIPPAYEKDFLIRCSSIQKKVGENEWEWCARKINKKGLTNATFEDFLHHFFSFFTLLIPQN